MRNGFVGLGVMGAPMARNLAAAGHGLTVSFNWPGLPKGQQADRVAGPIRQRNAGYLGAPVADDDAGEHDPDAPLALDALRKSVPLEDVAEAALFLCSAHAGWLVQTPCAHHLRGNPIREG